MHNRHIQLITSVDEGQIAEEPKVPLENAMKRRRPSPRTQGQGNNERNTIPWRNALYSLKARQCDHCVSLQFVSPCVAAELFFLQFSPKHSTCFFIYTVAFFERTGPLSLHVRHFPQKPEISVERYSRNTVDKVKLSQ